MHKNSENIYECINDHDGQDHTEKAKLLYSESTSSFPFYDKIIQQAKAIFPGAMVFFSGGMNIAWSIGFCPTPAFDVTEHITVCWFHGAIIGALFAAFLMNIFRRKYIMMFGVSLTTVCGMLLLTFSHNYFFVLIARYINGIANGLVFVPTITLAGEETTKETRRVIGSLLEATTLYMGICVQIALSPSWIQEKNLMFNMLQLQGLITLILAIVGILAVATCYVESPVFHLKRNDEERARDSLCQLQRSHSITEETETHLNEHKEYLRFNAELSRMQSVIEGIPALFKLCIFRAMLSISFSTFIYTILTVMEIMSRSSLDCRTYILIAFGFNLPLGAIFYSLTQNRFGCKGPIFFGSLIAGLLTTAVWLLSVKVNTIDRASIIILGILVVSQFFVGYYTSASASMLSEAFPLRVKPYYIAITYAVQMIVQITACSFPITFQDLYNYFQMLGLISLGFSIFVMTFLPNTKQTTLIGAQKEFQKIFNTF